VMWYKGLVDFYLPLLSLYYFINAF